MSKTETDTLRDVYKSQSEEFELALEMACKKLEDICGCPKDAEWWKKVLLEEAREQILKRRKS